MAAAYDTYDYPAYWEGRTYEHLSEISAIQTFLQQIPKIDKLVEIGCGFGRLAPAYIYRCRKAFLTEPSGKLLKEARKRLEDFSNIVFLQSTLQNLPKKTKFYKFDLVLMVRVLHHIPDTNQAFEIINKMTKPGGYLILEFANKVHWKALTLNFLKGDFTFLLDIFPKDIRSRKNLKAKSIPFINYHPDLIKQKLAENGFDIVQTLSVSNIRSGFIKRHIPVNVLISIEKLIQKPLTYLNFGPSVFVLARKRID